jgi:hypothetical protein
VIPLLVALLGGVCFPLEAEGSMGAYSFFQQDEAHFIFAHIENMVEAVRLDRYSLALGLTVDTYMGKNLNNPEMKFNIYGGHWNINLSLRADISRRLRARLYTDHECFHNIDMPDTSSEYMNNVKLGVVWEPEPVPYHPRPTPLPRGRLPSGWFSLGTYLPEGESFQKGHDFQWSAHTDLELPLAGWRTLEAGCRYHWDAFFHEDRGRSSRHRLELYTGYAAPMGSFQLYLAGYPRDTQPFRRLEGRSFWGIRFIWPGERVPPDPGYRVGTPSRSTGGT